MHRKKLIKRLIYIIFFILIVNFLANKFYWYSAIWYFDMLMHFLGGFWVGLISLYFFTAEDKSFSSVFKILLLVFLIGIGWEVFEILVNDVIAKNSFNSLDTISDIFFDLAGGTMAVLYFFKKIMLQSEDGLWGKS